jgi:hypothetical protein
MVFKTVCSAYSLVFLALLLNLSLQAQEISSEIYETEEDLREGLESGALTLDQYLELLDLIQAKIEPNSEEADKLFFVPGVSTGDVSQIQSNEEKDVLLNLRARRKRTATSDWRWLTKAISSGGWMRIKKRTRIFELEKGL